MGSASHVTGAASPELIFETLRAYERTAALRTAIELDLFRAIGEGPGRCGIARPPMLRVHARHPHSLRLPDHHGFPGEE